MSRFDRIYRIHELLRSARRPVPMRVFMEELEASRNTITRDFEFLRDSLGAPIEYSREANGHQYDPDAPVFELPGFWMNSAELYALLACEQLLENVQPGLISNRLAPLKEKVRQLLGQSGHDAQQVSDRIRIQPIQARTALPAIFDPVAEATLSGICLTFLYESRSRPGSKRREVHPQRLLHYRSNWYLLAVCSVANELRLFSLDRIREPARLEKPAASLSDSELDTYTISSFGIFGGEPTAVAHLRFTPHAAQWVAEETWHPDQQAEWREDGFHLRVPYSDSRELVMDILRYGPEVQVLGPSVLRDEVAARVKKMVAVYW